MARDPKDIQADIEATRAELAEAIDAIVERVSPKRVLARSTDQAKAVGAQISTEARDAVEKTRRTVAELTGRPTRRVGPDGEVYETTRTVRTDRVFAGVGVLAAAVVVVVVVRQRRAAADRSAVERLLHR